MLDDWNLKRLPSDKMSKLSLFEKRKFAIMRALLKKPAIMFLDDQIESLIDDEISILEKLDKKYTEFTIQDIIELVNTWTNSVVTLDKLLYEDAKKEFDLISRTGFGTDGDEETKILDFNNVRGKFEENPFVKEVLRHIEIKTALGQELIHRIEHLG